MALYCSTKPNPLQIFAQLLLYFSAWSTYWAVTVASQRVGFTLIPAWNLSLCHTCDCLSLAFGWAGEVKAFIGNLHRDWWQGSLGSCRGHSLLSWGLVILPWVYTLSCKGTSRWDQSQDPESQASSEPTELLEDGWYDHGLPHP